MHAERPVPSIGMQQPGAQSSSRVHAGLHSKAPGVPALAHSRPPQQRLEPPHAPPSVAHPQAAAAAQNPSVPSAKGTQHPVSHSDAAVQRLRQPP